MALHELGHAGAVWLAGGAVASITLRPFSRSWISYQSNPHPLAAAWGGIILGTLLALLLLLIVWPFRHKATFAAALIAMTAGCALGGNGLYLLVGTLAGVGDPARLFSLGMSKTLLLVVGVLLTAGGCLLIGIISPLFGLEPGEPFTRRFLALELGLLPYLALSIGYRFMASRLEAYSVALMGSAAMLMWVTAIIMPVIPVAFKGRLAVPMVNPSRASAFYAVAVGILVVVGELVVF
jgi:hypothetical protein